MKESPSHPPAAALLLNRSRMTLPLWSCEHHQPLCFARTDTSLAMASDGTNSDLPSILVQASKAV